MEDKTPSLTTTVDVLTVAGETVSQRKETVAVSSEPVETKPKRRGRGPKSEI